MSILTFHLQLHTGDLCWLGNLGFVVVRVQVKEVMPILKNVRSGTVLSFLLCCQYVSINNYLVVIVSFKEYTMTTKALSHYVRLATWIVQSHWTWLESKFWGILFTMISLLTISSNILVSTSFQRTKNIDLLFALVLSSDHFTCIQNTLKYLSYFPDGCLTSI